MIIKLNTKKIFKASILLFFCLFLTNAINQRCSQTSSKVSQNPCPSNSFCNTLGYCVCQKGYFGNCQNKAQYIDNSPKSFTISQNTSYYIIQPTLFDYVYYQFLLQNSQKLDNTEYLNLWDDDGNMDQPTLKNALGPNKQLPIYQGWTSLMTPFFAFQNQPNSQKQLLIFGISLRNPGSLKITIQVQEVQLFGFDILFKILLILVGGILLISLGGAIYCFYKCRRGNANRTILMEEKYDIAHFQQYMPTQTVSKQIKQQICSVCLGQFKQNQEIRKTVCTHIFHKTCLDEWCVTNLSCPICRTSFEKGNLIHHSYLNSKNQQNSNNGESLLENHVINGQPSLRSPIL